MAPKSSQRTSLGSSQPQPFQAAITKLCKAIDKAKTQNGEIKAETLVNKIRDFLKEYRGAEKILGSETITEVFPSLENNGSNICGRLDPATFCTVVEIALQSEACIDGERSLFLLAQSLFNDAKDPKTKAVVESRKNDIGKGCLQQALRYFLNSEVAPTMRRWAGALCIQLFRDSEENCLWLELGPDEFRQNIGRLVLEEPDEILRMIYAQLVRILHEAEIPLKDLFPAELAEEVYADFPPSTQEGFGWGGSFQTFMDNLYDKGVVEVPESIGNLYLGSTITMLPQRTIGVPGHNVYIFVDEEELSILSPAQSNFFDQILDIPLRSIKHMSIITDAHSQLASSIGLELRSGKGHDVFLNSKQIQLNKIYVTCLPDHVEHFKNELIGSCPSLEAIETDKRSVLNLVNSEDENSAAPHSSVTEEIISGSQAGRHQTKKPSSKPFRAARLRTNSIPETQVEEHNDERSMDAGDELQHSVHAIIPAAQDEDEDFHGATPPTAKAPSKDTPGQNSSAFKPTLPDRARKGVKPKAKAPIVQRDLRSKANQETPKDLASAPQAQTRAEQKQITSRDNVQEEPPSQEGKGKRRQPESVAAAQHSSESPKTKAFGANSQAKSTGRPTRSSQITDDIEDSDATRKPKLLQSSGVRRTLVASANAGASSSKSIPGRPTDPQKSKPRVKETNRLSRDSKDLEYQKFSDDFITSPDEMDASTPNTRKTPAASTTKTTVKYSNNKAATTSQQKRYSLHPAPKSKKTVGDMYDFPVDDDDNDESHPKTKTKKSTNTKKSAPKAIGPTKAVSKSRAKADDTNKRQSAPAVLDRPVATRSSQRAAATKAKEQLRDTDKSDDDDVDVVAQAASLKLKTTQKSNTAGDATKLKVTSKSKVSDKMVPATEQVEGTSALPQEDTPLSKIAQDPINHIDGDDLYDATPKLRSRKPAVQTLPKTVENPNAADIPNALKQSKTNSVIDFSSKLGTMIGGLSNDQAETESQITSVLKELENSIEPTKSKPGKKSDDSVPTVRNAANSIGYKSIAAKREENRLIVKMREVSEDPSSLTEEQEQSVVSPSVPVAVAAPEQKTASPPTCKSKGNYEKTFKEPDIPERPKTLDRPAKGEPSTGGSIATNDVEQDEFDRDMAPSQVNGDVHVEAAASEVRRKRRPDLDKTPQKKQRTGSLRNQAKEASPLSSMLSSPPVRAKPKKSLQSTKDISAIRRSPRLVERAKNATEALHQATADETSVTKDPDRKPHLVSFGGKGALNQGVSSITKVRQDHLSVKNVSGEASKQNREDVQEKKRKRERIDIAEDEGPPNKRQSTSPSEAIVVDAQEDDDLPFLQDSSVVATIKTKSTQNRRTTRPPTRPSSQTSRVDKNGSPIASSKEDHFGRLRERLAVPASASVNSQAVLHERRLSEVFGPKVMLENKAKGRVSSPEEAVSRYVVHERNGNDVYHEIATKQVIAHEKQLQDPFNEHARKSSDFTGRLMGDSSTGKNAVVSAVDKDIVSKKSKSKPHHDEATFPSHPKGVSKTNALSEPAPRTQQVDHRERTRVEIENQHLHNQSMPSDMTTGTSCESRSSEPSRMPLGERPSANDIWNVAIRPPPHYTNLHDAVHRIADELIIRLTDEEQRMDLLIKQYEQEGGKILGKLEQRHQNQRATVIQALDHKKMEMLSIYSEAKELVLETANELKENATSQFEREWRKTQDAIRAEISEGRKVSET